MLSEQEIEKWLEDLGVLIGYELHRIAAGEETALQQILKDGIVCCRIVNCIIPNKIPKVTADKSADGFRENFGYFTSALSELGVRPLCRSEDVLDAIEQVQECITALKIYASNRNLKKYDESFGPDFKGSDGKALTVMATFDYEAQNMDELTFTKGSIITVTQMVDGGWWEGELDGDTGWFPSNFVKEFGVMDTGQVTKRVSAVPVDTNPNDYEFYKTVVQDIIDSEREYLADIKNLTDSLLVSLRRSKKLKPSDVEVVCRYTNELKMLHTQLLQSLSTQQSKPVLQQQIGGTFLQYGQRIKELYGNFCSNHPPAAHLITSNMAQLEEGDIKVIELTQHLCKPYKRVERYLALLTELEYHVKTNHKDFSHISDCINIFHALLTFLTDVRKKKESELAILLSDIQGWSGTPMSQLGNIVLFSSVWFTNSQQEKNERYFLLFSEWLIILSVETPYKFIDKIATKKLRIEPMALADEEGDYEDPAVTSFVIRVGGEFYGSANVHSLRDKDRWCEISANMAQKPTLPKGGGGTNKHPIYAELPNMRPWSIKFLRPAPPAKIKIESITSPKLRKRLGIGSVKGKSKNSQVLNTTPEAMDYSGVLSVIDSYCSVSKGPALVR
ncbi:hypothetical protein ACHWQZ_G014176 [Mnemiopsis leidyi]